MSDNEDPGCLAGCMTLAFGPGMVLAMIISWELNRSILWALFHGYCSWGYILYHLFFRHH